MPQNDVVFILGAARSGTSALTRVLSLVGCQLPRHVFAPNSANPRGFWEPVEATRLNMAYLTEHGSMLEDHTFRMFEGRIDENEREEFIQKIQMFLLQCDHGAAVVIKELRVAILMEFWLEAVSRCGLNAKIVVAVRHPAEVAASLSGFAQLAAVENPEAGKLGPVSVETASANWLKLNLVAERASRALPRVFVEYGNLLTDWRREVMRISGALDVDLRVDCDAVDGFLTGSLWRQRWTRPPAEPFAYAWMRRVYSILSSASRDAVIDTKEMDEIYEAFRANERSFRIALEEFQMRFDVIRAFQRDAMKAVPVWTLGVEF